MRASPQQVRLFQLRISRHQRQIRSSFDTMRPLAVLIGIIMGSTFTLFTGLTLTWVTLLFVPADEAGELFGEKSTLGTAIAIFGTLSAVAAVSFYAQLRERSWRGVAHLVLTLCFCTSVWLYWPKK